jgi:hypothetical protein
MEKVTIVTGVGASEYAQTLKSENSKTVCFVDTGNPYVLKHRAVARSIYWLLMMTKSEVQHVIITAKGATGVDCLEVLREQYPDIVFEHVHSEIIPEKIYTDFGEYINWLLTQ